MIAEFFTRLRFFILRKKRSELDDEMQFHLEQSIAAKKRQGCPQASHAGEQWSSLAA